MHKPKTMEQYIELVNQALIEIDDLRMSAEYDLEEMGDALMFVEKLEAGVRKLYDQLVNGTHTFGDSDFPFMVIVEQPRRSGYG